MARRRKKRNSELDLATIIVGIVFLLALAYTKQVKAALHLGLIILVICVAIVGLIVYLRCNGQQAAFSSTFRSSRSHTRRPKTSILRKKDQEFERQIKNSKISMPDKALEWSLELIRSLNWKRFEELCAGYFQAKGRKAKVTNLGADGGIDVLLYGETDPEKILGVVQCKAWTQKPVGVREVRELLGVMTDVGCPLGVYVATSGYTADAKAFSEGKHINLMDAAKLLELIQKLPEEAQAKLLQATTAGDYTTPSCPSCGIKLVLRVSRKGQGFWGCRNFPRCRYTMHQAKSAS